MLENRDKRQTRMDPAEIGSNADAAALLTPGAAAGTLDGSTGVATPGASAVGEDAGERLTPGAAAGVTDNPQLEREGAETLQAEGRVSAFETFKTTPN